MKHRYAVPQKKLLTTALLLALAQPVYAQDATDPETQPQAATTTAQDQAAAEKDAKTLDTVVVTGIRGSLTSSMNLKRDAQGVVDGIVAEDIGKFPDTNLAESLQRISGVSIDRSIGEGSKVTVRGVGPDFNLVLLNGRQMPASSIADGAGASELARVRLRQPRLRRRSPRSRSTRPAAPSTPTGGIGATINIKTARPLDDSGLRTAASASRRVLRHLRRQPAEHAAGRRRHAAKSRASSATPSPTASSASR